MFIPAISLRKADAVHLGCSRRRQHTHAFAERCAAGDHIVEQQDAPAPYIGKVPHAESTAHIGGTAARVQQLLLGLCMPCAAHQ